LTIFPTHKNFESFEVDSIVLDWTHRLDRRPLFLFLARLRYRYDEREDASNLISGVGNCVRKEGGRLTVGVHESLWVWTRRVVLLAVLTLRSEELLVNTRLFFLFFLRPWAEAGFDAGGEERT